MKPVATAAHQLIYTSQCSSAWSGIGQKKGDKLCCDIGKNQEETRNRKLRVLLRLKRATGYVVPSVRSVGTKM